MIKRDIRELYILVKGTIKEEDIMVHHDDIFHNTGSKYIKLWLTEMHKDIDVLISVARD